MQDNRAEKSRTVVHVAPTPFFADRGCHVRIRNEIDSLIKYSYRIIICTYPIGRDVSGMDIRRTWPIPGYHKLDTGFSPFRFIADFLLFFLSLKTVWQQRPVLLHCHLHEGALIGWAVKICLFWRRIPIIMDMQGSLSGELAAYNTFDSMPFLLRFFKGVEQLICWMPDFFVCSSWQGKHCLEQDFKVSAEKILLVQDMVPDDVFAAAAHRVREDRKHLIASRKVILYTGSLLSGKGVQHILEAMKLLSTRRDDLYFILVGYPLEDSREYIKENNLEKICLLPGQVDYKELADWLLQGDIAVEPKEAESGEASGKMLHYMAAGLPVVCFDTENNRRMLGSAGYFAPGCAGAGLVQGIEDALDDMGKARQRGREGWERAHSHHSFAAVGRILNSLYDRFTTGRSDW